MKGSAGRGDRLRCLFIPKRHRYRPRYGARHHTTNEKLVLTIIYQHAWIKAGDHHDTRRNSGQFKYGSDTKTQNDIDEGNLNTEWYGVNI